MKHVTNKSTEPMIKLSYYTTTIHKCSPQSHMVSASRYFQFSMFNFQRSIPVLSLFKHLQGNHVASDPAPRSSYGMDLVLCGTDRRWWVHALSRSAGRLVSGGASRYFLISSICLQARNCISNAWDRMSALFFLVEMW